MSVTAVARRRGKEAERAVARHLGGRRVGNSGLATCDVTAGRFAVEVKSRAELPGWLTGAMNQARANAGPGRTPLLVLHQVGDRHASDLVVLTLADWCQWFGDLTQVAEVASA